MTTTQPDVCPNGRYELLAASQALGVHRSTLLRYTHMGLIKCSISTGNGRHIWRGSEIIRFWRQFM